MPERTELPKRIVLLLLVWLASTQVFAVEAQEALGVSCDEALMWQSGILAISPRCTVPPRSLPLLRGVLVHELRQRQAGDAATRRSVAAVNGLIAYAMQQAGEAVTRPRHADYAVASVASLVEKRWSTLVAPEDDNERNHLLEIWKQQYVAVQEKLDQSEREFIAGQQLERKGAYAEALLRFETATKIAESIGYTNIDYLNAYAAVALKENDRHLAARAYAQILAEVRRRSEAWPEAYRERVAETLVHCANLCTAEAHSQVRMGSLGPHMAEEGYRMFSEAVAIYRELVTAAPQRYSAGLAETLCKFGASPNSRTSPSALNNDLLAVRLVDECLKIYRAEARLNPVQYRPLLANALISYISVTYRPSRSGEINQPIQIALIAEGVAMFRELATNEPYCYKAQLARGLRHLAAMRIYYAKIYAEEAGREAQFNLAAEHLRESRDLYRELAKAEPNLFTSELAAAYYDYGSLLYNNLKHYPEAYVELVASLELTRPQVESDTGFRRWWDAPYSDRLRSVRTAARRIGNYAMAEEMTRELESVSIRRRALRIP